MSEEPDKVERFLDYLAKNGVILSYWSEQRGELMPITYQANELAANFANKKPPISGNVRRVA